VYEKRTKRRGHHDATRPVILLPAKYSSQREVVQADDHTKGLWCQVETAASRKNKQRDGTQSPLQSDIEPVELAEAPPMGQVGDGRWKTARRSNTKDRPNYQSDRWHCDYREPERCRIAGEHYGPIHRCGTEERADQRAAGAGLQLECAGTEIAGNHACCLPMRLPLMLQESSTENSSIVFPLD